MANHHWSHSVPGDPVHFENRRSPDNRGDDVRAFQRLWNRNHPNDKIAVDGDYGPQTAARLKKAPATGFAKGAFCKSGERESDLLAVDGPDKIAPGTRAKYVVTLANNSGIDWPASRRRGQRPLRRPDLGLAERARHARPADRGGRAR